MYIEAPHRRTLGKELRVTLWQQPLWAIPFALFFGLLYGPSAPTLWLSYKISLVFAYVIRLVLVGHFVYALPALTRRFGRGGDLPLSIEAPSIVAAALAGSYLGAAIVHFFLLPGFLGSTRAVAVAGAYSVVFVLLFSGIAYARHFYGEALERARAVERMRAELAEAELRALRAQVNPHFLFNTLNSIASLIASSPAAAEETTTRLAEIFRYALAASERERARLADELEFLRNYLEIERTRFGGRLRVVEQVEPGLEGALVPTLLLQPLVENAVRYGVSARAEGGTVRIAARREDEKLRLEVADDGPGLAPDAAPSGAGFGLRSVRERIAAAGPPHALEIESRPGRGTSVSVTLPLLMAELGADTTDKGGKS